MSKQDDDAIAAFLAKKQVSVIPPGQSGVNYSPKDWQKAVRGEPVRRAKERPRTTHGPITTGHDGREWTTNEHGEIILLG